MNRSQRLFLSVFSLSALLLVSGCGDDDTTTSGNGGVNHDSTFTVSHFSADDYDLISDSAIVLAQSTYSIYYGHTSHGSQIMTGMNLLVEEGSLAQLPAVHEVGDDLGHNGDTSWVPLTRNWLNAHPECNMVMWSWCGGCSDNTESGINIYLQAMAGLEADYPDVIFVYMTGHLDGTGIDGNLYARNNQIRAYCTANNKILYDFADIESYDPSGTYYPNESDACSWCSDWCSSRSCETCSCAHSHCFNCYRKGRAFMWLLARLSGWDGN